MMFPLGGCPLIVRFFFSRSILRLSYCLLNALLLFSISDLPPSPCFFLSPSPPAFSCLHIAPISLFLHFPSLLPHLPLPLLASFRLFLSSFQWLFYFLLLSQHARIFLSFFSLPPSFVAPLCSRVRLLLPLFISTFLQSIPPSPSFTASSHTNVLISLLSWLPFLLLSLIFLALSSLFLLLPFPCLSLFSLSYLSLPLILPFPIFLSSLPALDLFFLPTFSYFSPLFHFLPLPFLFSVGPSFLPPFSPSTISILALSSFVLFLPLPALIGVNALSSLAVFPCSPRPRRLSHLIYFSPFAPLTLLFLRYSSPLSLPSLPPLPVLVLPPLLCVLMGPVPSRSELLRVACPPSSSRLSYPSSCSSLILHLFPRPSLPPCSYGPRHSPPPPPFLAVPASPSLSPSLSSFLLYQIPTQAR
ncbi:hypothetical protein C7M84_009186 [Penaeus vannamei]|uniref:Uncharacterized protein n=1 Tax=Penaeus vannamei TaxID=6689 RepID=A0A3R7M466_PENVA|nr:hypothetical protein C7M84_009186 [Penaeus vannamei]